MQKVHVVFGSSGPVGTAVVQDLVQRGLPVRAIQRSGRSNFATEQVEIMPANVLDVEQTLHAVQGAAHVYLSVGLPYRTVQWQREWPVVMENMISACAQVGAKLIFLDNIYMYGPAPLANPFTESHSQQPTSKKGVVRKQIADMLLQAHQTGRVQAVIGRSADFYGPSVNSILYISFLQNMLNGKSPQTIGKLDVPHTFAHTSDNGRALVELALDETTYGEVWHLPVSRPVTALEANELFNNELCKTFKLSQLSPLMLSLLGLFIPPIKEIKEMLYQFESPYMMSDAKFRAHFPDFQVTRLEAGMQEMVHFFKGRNGDV
jgi:nucleoside-diphosphate-sugar epimerase